MVVGPPAAGDWGVGAGAWVAAAAVAMVSGYAAARNSVCGQDSVTVRGSASMRACIRRFHARAVPACPSGVCAAWVLA